MPRRILIAVLVALAAVASLVIPVQAQAASGCPTSACLYIIGTNPIRPVTHFASGVTDSVVAGEPATVTGLSQLAVSMYRGTPVVWPHQTLSWANWATATSKGAATTLILQDLWNQEHGPGYPPTPWSNWAAYDSWVATTVSQVLRSGQKVTYWEPYSEPGWRNVYSPADFKAETVSDLLQQFEHTYVIIKALVPGAAVVGPSDGLFTTTPLRASANNKTPDVNTFLNFCAQQGIKLAAFAIHENIYTPAQVTSMVAYVRAAIAKRPQLGNPPVYVDEFASSATAPIPGWQVGYLSALEYSGTKLAAGSCWTTCWAGDLDSSLMNNGKDKTGVWFVNRTYAQMSGSMVGVLGGAGAFAGVASANPRARSLVALIGRDQGCAVAQWCQREWYPAHQTPLPARSLQVSIVIPWTGAAHVQLSEEPFRPNQAVTGTQPVAPSGLSVKPYAKGSELVTFTIPAFADGAAYNVVVTG